MDKVRNFITLEHARRNGEARRQLGRSGHAVGILFRQRPLRAGVPHPADAAVVEGPRRQRPPDRRQHGEVHPRQQCGARRRPARHAQGRRRQAARRRAADPQGGDRGGRDDGVRPHPQGRARLDRRPQAQGSRLQARHLDLGTDRPGRRRARLHRRRRHRAGRDRHPLRRRRRAILGGAQLFRARIKCAMASRFSSAIPVQAARQHTKPRSKSPK